MSKTTVHLIPWSKFHCDWEIYECDEDNFTFHVTSNNAAAILDAWEDIAIRIKFDDGLDYTIPVVCLKIIWEYSANR